MAPISEKRPQPQNQSHIKENGHGHGHMHIHTHAKENTNGVKGKKGLEILDFHESWLEEMEIYRDKMYVNKNPLLGSHNHGFGAQGSLASHLVELSSSSIQAKRKSASGVPVNGFITEHNNLNQNKSRISARQMPSNTTSVVADSISIKPGIQLLLKRPRDDTASLLKSTGGNSKRYAHPNVHASNNTNTALAHRQLSPQKNSKSPTRGGSASGGNAGVSNDNKTAARPSSPPKSPNKIIVNQFHASSLLSSHHNDEKTKLLTQNGLTKSAATAYETSLYASHYLPHDNRTFNMRQLNADNTNYNYVGISFAKVGDGERNKDGHRSTTEEDPCSAIDDVNEYTDSESDEEYKGCAFFIYDDEEYETAQSRNIRFCPERETNASEEDSEADSEAVSEYFKPDAILTPSIFPNVPPYLNFSSHVDKGPSMPQVLHRVLKWKLSPVMPKIVKRVVLNSGFRIIKNTTDWMAIWEKHMKSPGFRTIRSHQKYNHMPGSFRIGRKDSMWRSIHINMKKYGKKEFGFMQKSYIMPDDLESLRQVWPKNASKLTKWIVKPPASARGTGIRIVNKWSQFPKDRPLVVQKYIERPLLINDNKFDMRIYVVLTSINPLRIYMYKDGLARFASVKYSSGLTTLDDRCMHLTNYSINKFSQNYAKNEDFNACQGHKWTLQSLWSCLESRGVNTKRLWATLRNLVIKAIISGESGLNRMYRQNVNFRYNCFELFGFDVLLDENLVPWLLEINISPSLHSELPLDLHVKGPLIQAVLNTALYQVPPKLTEKQQKEIQEELNLDGPLCHDKRIFTTCLTADEVRKHNQFTNRSIEFREEYLDSILDNLLPDDIRCLIIAEDEYARCAPLERVFPTPNSFAYLKFIENPRYYNRLLDAWEHRYGNDRAEGIELLKQYCNEGYHLNVSEAALEKEPNVDLTEIDMLHQRKSDDAITLVGADNATGDSTNASKAGSPESNGDGHGR